MIPPVRPFRKADAEGIHAVFRAAVREGSAGRYSEAQRMAWASADSMPESWPGWLDGMDTLVAEDGEGIAGFMAATAEGYLDMAFVHPRWMGRGLAQALYDPLLAKARARGICRMTAHASHLARPFLARNGWRVDYPETVTRNGVALDRFAMSLEPVS